MAMILKTDTITSFPIETSSIPIPGKNDLPSVYADQIGTWYSERKTNDHRKEFGLYMTPTTVAYFMSKHIQTEFTTIRILDPSAGTGILSCAAVETLAIRQNNLERIEITAYEIDANIAKLLNIVFEYLMKWCRTGYGIDLCYQINVKDFILSNSDALRDEGWLIPNETNGSDFDLVICNPPYFKISKTDPRASATASVIYGQPNIYALFMAVGAALLRLGGDFIFITPRSFTSGPYFRLFRKKFFNIIRPVNVHVFDSRRETFQRDNILQENIIIFGVREDGWNRQEKSYSIAISSSQGSIDILKTKPRLVPLSFTLNITSKDKVLRIPTDDNEDFILSLIDNWPGSLHSYGLNISTGPIVPFRSKSLIDREGDVPSTHSPLLWMNHVKPMKVIWPLNKHKSEYIKNDAGGSFLVWNKNYVLLRRFSAKEERRRLVAAPYFASSYTTTFLGLENHLNYIHRPDGTITEDEAFGLAALYNSSVLDTYFRCINGNTQVNATELRTLPLPPLETIIKIGQQIKQHQNPLLFLDKMVFDLTTNKEMKFLEGKRV